MARQMRQVIKTCRHCLQYKGSASRAPLCPIVATAPMDLLHIDFMSIETTMELDKSPRVANVLVFQDYFTKYVLVNCENHCQISVWWLYLYIWSPGQATE